MKTFQNTTIILILSQSIIYQQQLFSKLENRFCSLREYHSSKNYFVTSDFAITNVVSKNMLFLILCIDIGNSQLYLKNYEKSRKN